MKSTENCYFALVAVQSFVIMSVCLSVCPLTYLNKKPSCC